MYMKYCVRDTGAETKVNTNTEIENNNGDCDGGRKGGKMVGRGESGQQPDHEQSGCGVFQCV
jgi:hypothetical protein